MNSSSLLTLLISASLLVPLSAQAAPGPDNGLPRDVPAKHWAAGAVGRVTHEKIMGRDPDDRFRGDQPVTRYELAVTLDRFVRYIESARKPLHAETAPTTPKQAIQHLVSSGFLKPNSLLLVRGGNGKATAAELSDALASVTIRLSDRAEAPKK